MPHGEHDPDKAEFIAVGSKRKVRNDFREFTKKHSDGTHPEYGYLRTIGFNNNLTRRYQPPAEAIDSKPEVSLTKGAETVLNAAIEGGIIDASEVANIQAGEDGKIYKKEAEAYIKGKSGFMMTALAQLTQQSLKWILRLQEMKSGQL
jgi:hypothetical protein